MERHPEYRYRIDRIVEDVNEETWIYIGDSDHSGWGENLVDWTCYNPNSGAIELLARIRECEGWNVKETGDSQYSFGEMTEMMFQWDDLFGLIVIVKEKNKVSEALNFLRKYTE